MKSKPFSDSAEHIKQTLTDLNRFGITYLSYGLISQGNLVNSYFSNKEWGQLYTEDGYNRYDPLFHGIINAKIPLIFWEALHPFGDEKDIMSKRFEVCQIKSGLTLGVNREQSTEILAVGATLSPKEFYSLINEETHMKVIQSVICRFYDSHKKVMSLQ